MCLGVDPTTIQSLQVSLKDSYGLELVEEERLIPVYELIDSEQ